MDVQGGLLVLGLAVASAVPIPTGVAPAQWPLGTATAVDSNSSWPGGFQPYRLSSWKMDAQGRPLPCWETIVLHDHAKGWPGLCLGLFHTGLEKVSDEKTCKDACWGDPRCSVFQFVTSVSPPQCWLGNGGTGCDFRGGSQKGFAIQAAQRLQHGKVHVYKNLVGIKVNKLYNFGLYAEGSQELSISRCRDWCYSSITCEYWQYSKNDGCWVDAPALSSKRGKDATNVVDYPLTASSITTGTPEAQSIIAGEFIQHYCAPKTGAEVTATVAGTGPAAGSGAGGFGQAGTGFVVNTEPASSGPSTPVVILSALLVLVALGAVAYYCVAVAGKRKGGRDRMSMRSSSDYSDEEEDYDMSAAKLAPYGPGGYQQPPYQQPPSPPRYPGQGQQGSYGGQAGYGQPPTTNFQQGAPYGGGMQQSYGGQYGGQYGGYNARVM